jgi:hypothetical protein
MMPREISHDRTLPRIRTSALMARTVRDSDADVTLAPLAISSLNSVSWSLRRRNLSVSGPSA